MSNDKVIDLAHAPRPNHRLSWQRILQLIVYTICIITVIRFTREAFNHVYPSIEVGYDFRIYADAAQAFLRGVSPYNARELTLIREDTPIIFPPQIVLILPFEIWGIELGAILFFIFNVVISYLLFKAIFKQLGLWHPPTSINLSTENQLWLISLCVLFSSNSLIRALYMGQLTLVALTCLVFAMLAKRVVIRALFLAIALAAKYSLIPFIGLIFLIIRDIRTCLLAAALFLVIAISPILFGHNLYSLYHDYFLQIGNLATACGADTYCGGGGVGELLNFDFFKAYYLNIAVKTIFLILFAIAFFKEYIRKGVSLNFLMFANAITMIATYHRFYDMALLQLLMIASMNIFLYGHQWTHSVILGALLIFSVIPFRWINIFGTVIAETIDRNPWLYFESFGNYPVIFPTFGVYAFIIACYTAYLYFRGRPAIEFLRRCD